MCLSTSFNIYCMSYHRSDSILSKKMFEYCTYVVREEEAEKYRNVGVEDLLCIPDGEAHDFMSTLYWIINHTPEDVIYVADDDITNFVYRLNDSSDIRLKDGTPDKETITAEIERIAQLIYDLGIGYAFEQPTSALYAYNAAFRFVGMPGHMRWINKKALKAEYDPSDPAASDVDMMMQEVMKNRIILQPRYLCASANMDTKTVAMKDRQEHLTFVESMKNKWGKYYGYNYRRNIAEINVER